MSQNVKPVYRIDLQPIGKRVEITSGKTILEASQKSGINLVTLCGGEGWCFSCGVEIISGKVNKLSQNELDFFSEDEIKAGYRFACQVKPMSDVVVNIPPESLTTTQRLQIEGIEVKLDINPSVSFVDIEIPAPSLEDLQSDSRRIKIAMQSIGIPLPIINFPVLSDLSEILRTNDWKVRLVFKDEELISILPINQELYGLAVDLGTTKIALYIINLYSGEVLSKVGEMNPQIAYGEDVISRIDYCIQNNDGRKLMQQLLVDTLNHKLSEIFLDHQISNEQIVDAVVVGNTAIHHLFSGLPVKQLVYAPYVPAISESIDLRAIQIGILMNKGAYVHLLPNIAGYVGADHSAVLLATELWKTEKTVIAIDIGTNTEITLATKNKLLSCSCASGPAFEGAHVRHGMRAAPGAIEKIQIVNNDEIRLFTIENQLPIGICGSGILDAVAELKKTGVIDMRGAFNEDHPRVRRDKSSRLEYLLVKAEESGNGIDITVTRIDVNEIQIAKAAIRAGLEILMTKGEIEVDDIDEIIIAGAFGSYIDIENAVKIGMFPDVPKEKFRQVGNAAGMGAIKALLSKKHRNLIQDVIDKVEYVDLTTHLDFQKEFIKAMYIN